MNHEIYFKKYGLYETRKKERRAIRTGLSAYH